MKKKKNIRLLGFLLVMMLVATACAKKDSTSYDTADNGSYDMNYEMDETTTASTEEAAPEYTAGVAPAEDQKSKSDGLSNTSTITTGNVVTESKDKIIRRFSLEVETQEFDILITKLDTEIDRLGGYVENAQISGKSYYYNDNARYGNIIARIPRDRVDEFVNSVDENVNANVINKNESTDNVTLQYTDMESRKKALEIEQERLFVLLEKTVTLENMITLESRLSDIRYELQNFETQLRTFDNQVDYSTVSLNIQEVERITPVVEEKQTVSNRIKNGFSDTMYNLSEGLKNFFVWFVVNLPYLIIWGVIFAVIALIIRKYVKKYQLKYMPSQAQPTSEIKPVQGPNTPQGPTTSV